MNLYVPLWLLYGPAAWLALGWVGRTAMAALYPGMPLVFGRGEWNRLMLLGPVLLLWGLPALWLEQRRAKRIRAETLARVAPGHPPTLQLVCAHILADQGLPASPPDALAALSGAQHMLGAAFDQRLVTCEAELATLAPEDLRLFVVGCQSDWTPACLAVSQLSHETVDELYAAIGG